jgi:hypothetical protein
MPEDVGFVSMAGAKATGEAPEVGVGMLGYAFMGRPTRMPIKRFLT